jgi:hypothetical protein
MTRFEALLAHETMNPIFGTTNPLVLQIIGNAAAAIVLSTSVKRRANLGQKNSIFDYTTRRNSFLPFIKSTGTDSDHGTQLSNGELPLVIHDKLHFGSESLAKYVAIFFKRSRSKRSV